MESNENCILAKHVDYNYIRNTAWDIAIDWDDNTCGTSQRIYPDHEDNEPEFEDQLDPGIIEDIYLNKKDELFEKWLIFR